MSQKKNRGTVTQPGVLRASHFELLDVLENTVIERAVVA